MSSLKCPSCGMVNFAATTACKRCQRLLRDHSLGFESPKHSLRYSPTASEAPSGDSSDLLERKPTKKLLGQVIGGTLISIGLLLGLATAITEDYSYLPFGVLRCS